MTPGTHRNKMPQEAADSTPRERAWTDQHRGTAAAHAGMCLKSEMEHQEATMKAIASLPLPAIPEAVVSFGLLLGIAAQLPATFPVQLSFGRLSLASAVTAGPLLLLVRR